MSVHHNQEQKPFRRNVSVRAGFCYLDNVSITGAADVRLRAIEGISDSEVHNAKSAFVSSHADATVIIKDTGSAVVSAMGEVTADIKVSGDLFLESASKGIKGSAEAWEQAEAALVGGKVVLSALKSIKYLVAAAGDVLVTAGDTISGGYLGRVVRATAFKTIDNAVFQSSLGTYVYARGSITGTMTSTDGSVTVRSSGNMPGTTTAIVNVTATAKPTLGSLL